MKRFLPIITIIYLILTPCLVFCGEVASENSAEYEETMQWLKNKVNSLANGVTFYKLEYDGCNVALTNKFIGRTVTTTTTHNIDLGTLANIEVDKVENNSRVKLNTFNNEDNISMHTHMILLGKEENIEKSVSFCIIVLNDSAMANRLANAFKSASKLCGGGKQEKF